MKKKYNVMGKFSLGFNYTETINEMIADGSIQTEEDIIEYIKLCMLEDVKQFVENDENILRNIQVIGLKNNL